MDNAQILLKKIQHIPVIDTHEHHAPEQYWSGEHTDFFSLLSPYVCDNLLTAGMSIGEWAALQNQAAGTVARLEILKPYLPAVRHTRYFQVVDRVVRNRYGLTSYTAKNWTGSVLPFSGIFRRRISNRSSKRPASGRL